MVEFLDYVVWVIWFWFGFECYMGFVIFELGEIFVDDNGYCVIGIFLVKLLDWVYE